VKHDEFGLDATNRRIIAALQDDGRITNQRLAEKAGISAAACWRRTKALEASGVIKKYMAIVDPKAVGYGLCAIVNISLTRHSKNNAEKFMEAARVRAEVQECYAVTGDADFMLRVVVPDMDAYDQFLEGFLFNIEGISQVRSNFALREIKFDISLPMPGHHAQS
jgi:Lrp/AsnC family transcriptional regulator, leucine-responsive regulatory protein